MEQIFSRYKYAILGDISIKLLPDSKFPIIFALVFHRILDFKAGLDFYLGPLFFIACFSKFILIAPDLLHL